jgi:hypothetical protein
VLSGLFQKKGERGPGTVVLELGESCVRALRISRQDRPTVHGAASLNGTARDALSRLARDRWFEGGRLRVMLGARQRETAILARPDVDDAELVDAMRWQIADRLPFPAEEALLDVLTIDDREPAARQQVIVMAAHRPRIAALLQPLARLRGQQVECLDVADCAQRNLAEAASGPGTSVACLTERDGSLLFTVSRGRDLVYSRAFELAAEGRDGELPGDRIAMQLLRAIDTIERRSPESAPVRMLVGPAAAQSPLREIARQCGLSVIDLDWQAGVDVDETARVDIEADPGLLLLVGIALRRERIAEAVGA